jgi:hypothetical protein
MRRGERASKLRIFIYAHCRPDKRPGAARRLVTFLARPRKVTERRPPLDSRPAFAGCPCAACLDVATAQLDLARHTQRASLRDSNSARRIPHIESSCSARLKGEKANTPGLTAFTQSSVLLLPELPGAPQGEFTVFPLSIMTGITKTGHCHELQCASSCISSSGCSSRDDGSILRCMSLALDQTRRYLTRLSQFVNCRRG